MPQLEPAVRQGSPPEPHVPRVAVRPEGDLDVATAPRVARLLREALATAPVVLLDLRGLVFMDVVGMHVVVEASARARRDGRRLEVIRGPAHVDAVFTLTGTDVMLDHAELDVPPEHLIPDVGTASLSQFMRAVREELAERIERRLLTELGPVLPPSALRLAPAEDRALGR